MWYPSSTPFCKWWQCSGKAQADSQLPLAWCKWRGCLWDTCFSVFCLLSYNKQSHTIRNFNVCFSHGNKEVFSCRGIKLAVDWFLERGHKDVTVFVPAWRKEQSRPDALIAGKLCSTFAVLFDTWYIINVTTQMKKYLEMKDYNRKYIWCSNFIAIFRKEKESSAFSKSSISAHLINVPLVLLFISWRM